MPSGSEIKDAIDKSDVRCIRGCTREQIMTYTHPTSTNALIHAARKADLETLKTIYKKIGRSDCNKLNKAIDAYGRSAFINAVVSRDVEKVNYIFGLRLTGTDINGFDEGGKWRAIDHCVVNFDARVFEWLIENGACIYRKTWKQLHAEVVVTKYFTPESFLEVVTNRKLKLFRVHCDFFDQQKDSDVYEYYLKKFLECKDGKDRHALLICAHDRNYEMFAKLLEYDFNLEARDSDKHTLFYYLLRDKMFGVIDRAMEKLERLKTSTKEEFKKELPRLDYNTQKRRNEIGRMLTRTPPFSFDGRYRVANPKVDPRPYRSFETERTRQLLRQISTQIFLYLSIGKKASVFEIESLFLSYKDSHYLFIVGNPLPITKEKQIKNFTCHIPDLSAPGRLREIITKPYCNLTKDKGLNEKIVGEANIRTLRYATKIRRRIYNSELPSEWPDNEDKKRANALCHILRAGEVKVLERTTDVREKGSFLNIEKLGTDEFCNKIILIGYDEDSWIKPRYTELHAEEIFVDLLEDLEKVGFDKNNMHSIIGGKKRPCAGCFSRMLQARVDEQSRYPGYYWLHSMKNQPAPAAKNTAQVLLETQAHESLDRTGKIKLGDFDSGSDSDN